MMKKINIITFVCGLMLAGTMAYAGKGNWERIYGTVPSTNEQAVFPNNYTAFHLDDYALAATLKLASTSPDHPVTIMLPDAENHFQTFRVWETPVMAPELQAKFPNIRSYTGVCEGNETITAKITSTSQGFHIMVYSPENNYFIAPYSRVRDGYYLVFNQRDYTRTALNSGICGVGSEQQTLVKGTPANIVQATSTPSPGLAMRQNGEVRRVYRCAIACTAEWAILVAGNAPSTENVMSVITALLNNANGVFERELSVTMELIPENDQLVYLDPNTDPYTCDPNNDCLIGENQTNFDALFPTGDNYDIGHILNTAGGGLAQLNSVCQNGGKASGVSGAFSAEDIGTIIHEMGHQMGSQHTFNSDQGGCSGNGSETSAYEPGSGTSIMSYNGSCAVDNVQGPSIDYYHVYSLDAMTTFLSSLTCGLPLQQLGVEPISIPDLADTYAIPKNTPFELLAPEAEASENNPLITYNWEQWDLGHFKELEAGSATWDAGPIMQSFEPTTERRRTFPKMNVILSGQYNTIGQRLPNAQRVMNYRLTARSFKDGWGTFNTTTGATHIKVGNNSQFRVLTPNDTATWEVGSVQTITWDTGGSRAEPVSCYYVDIFISYDGGHTFSHQIVGEAPNTGSYNWTVTDVYSDSVRFKVKGSGNVFFDISPSDVFIHGNPNGVKNITDDNAIQVFPNPASSLLSIRYSKTTLQPLTVDMYNLIGQKVWSGEMGQSLDIPVSGFARGSYFVHIYDADSGQRRVKKVVLQ